MNPVASSPRGSHRFGFYPCGQCRPGPVDRRQWLQSAGNGFGMAALLGLLQQPSFATHPSNAGPKPHHRPRARSVIFLYMDGGPSQIDTFDPKPLLQRFHGQDPGKLFNVEATQFNNNGMVLASPWSFARYGECGHAISELFPRIATCADELCVIRSMISEFSEHTSANYFLHTGSGLQGRPGMGAWTTYGLGSENQDLPGFVVINGGLIPPGGLDCFGSGFLPASFQGTLLKPSGTGIANAIASEADPVRERKRWELVAQLDRESLAALGAHDCIESAIRNYELAAQMQLAVPELMDLQQETEATHRMYGLDAPYEPTRIFAAECLLARRLVERGVRFIELTCPQVQGDRWDQHGQLKKGHENNARAVDRPIAALIRDLRQRGLLEETLVIWAGEFGRTPFAQGADGRDHNPFGFTIWMCGGGVRRGMVYGQTDEWGYKAIEQRTEIHDLHATMLYLLGIDHTRSTFRFGGRDMRLTDVKGHVIHPIIA